MAEIITVRLVHVLGGIFWVGSALFTALFLVPSMAEAGPAAGAVMGGMQRRRVYIVLPVVALLTILSGARLMAITSGGFNPAYFTSGRGLTFTLGAVAALLAFLLGVLFARPAGVRMGAIGVALRDAQDDATKARLGAEMQQLQRRMNTINVLNVILLLGAATGMAIGRYVP